MASDKDPKHSKLKSFASKASVSHRDQNEFRPKSLKASNAELGSVCTRGSGGPPPEFFWLLGLQLVHSGAILGHCTLIPLPRPLQKKILFRFTLISRMVLESEIRLKSDNFDPWAMVTTQSWYVHCTLIPLPCPLQKKILFRFTLISKMVPEPWLPLSHDMCRMWLPT